MVKVTVKWNKQKFDDIDVSLDESALVFKAQLFAMTGVPVERQKIMGVKGGVLKDDADMKNLGLKDGQVLMLMGSAEELKAPEKQTVFMEDLTDEQANQLSQNPFPPGLVNLGNTCYMNATLQCLRNVPELRDALRTYINEGSSSSSGGGGDSASALTTALRELFMLMDSSNKAAPPLVFLNILRQAYPQFAQQGKHGFMQQDAEECWSQLMQALHTKLKKKSSSSSSSSSGESVTAELFSGDTVSTMKNTENADETPTTNTDRFVKLVCHISSTTSFLLEGLKEGLQEDIMKQSATLGREAKYLKASQLTRLPYYLTVQFMRFYWKQDVKGKAKVVRPVEFPFMLDVYGLCTPELQQKLAPQRKLLDEEEEANVAKERERKKTEEASKGKDKDVAMVDAPATQVARVTPASFENLSGRYDLVAVLTHKGRDADSGHYVAWVKQANGTWLLFDDDKVREMSVDEIKKLSGKGGGDWHMAYMCLYRTIAPTAVPTTTTTTTTTSS